METTFSFRFDDSDYLFLDINTKIKEYIDLLVLEGAIYNINSISRLIRSEVAQKPLIIVTGDSVDVGKLFFRKTLIVTGSEYAEGKLLFYVR